MSIDKSASVNFDYLLTAINFGNFISAAVFAVECPGDAVCFAFDNEVAALGEGEHILAVFVLNKKLLSFFSPHFCTVGHLGKI